MSILPPSEQKILGALLDEYPDALSREDLLVATGYKPRAGASTIWCPG